MEPLDPSSRRLTRKYIPQLSEEDLNRYDGWFGQFVEALHPIVGGAAGPQPPQPVPPALPPNLAELLQKHARQIGRVQRLQLARRRLAVRKGKYGFNLRRGIGDIVPSTLNYLRYYGAWLATMPSLLLGRLRFLLIDQFRP